MRRFVAKAKRRCGPSGKVRYRDEESAVRALRFAATLDGEHKPVRAYVCPDCHGWHLTHRRTWK